MRLCLALAVALGWQIDARADYSTTVNPGNFWGIWDGWGTSLCWWANVFGNRDDLANLFFTTSYVTLNGQTLPGLGLNIARYNAGACSTNAINGSVMQASQSIPPFKQMPGYWLDWFSADPTTASWSWTVDANQRAMLQKARVRGANWLELFSNSPMWWMCYNHNPSGADSGGSDNLQSWNYQAHAVYLTTIVKYARDHWGLSFNSVEAFNEPSANWWTSAGTQEGCHFDNGTQASVIGYLRAELDNRGLTNAVVSASDETSYDAATATWSSFSSTTRSQVGRVNVHGYQYGGGRRDLLYSAVAGKRLWNSEYGEGDGTGVSLASNLNLDFRWLHMTGWCYWQVLDSGGWGLIQSNPGDNWIGTANPKYYVLAQYTRHIRPGMKILDGGEGNTIAAYDTNSHKLVLVTMNYDSAQWISYDLSNLFNAAGPIRRWLTTTGPGVKYAPYSDISITNRILRCWFTTNTIQTFEIQNVYLTASPPPVPTELAAIAGNGQVSLSWGTSIGATSYNLKRSPISGGTRTILASTATTNYVDLTVTNGATYYYVLSAVSPGGESNDSNEVNATPHPPLTLSALRGAAWITLTWPNWATGYTAYSATNLSPQVFWQPVGGSPQTNESNFFLTIPATNFPGRYFRLQTP